MAQFYQVAGTQLVLPDYARVDRAITTDMPLADNGLLGTTSYVASGPYVDVVLAFFVTLTTSSAVATRTMQLEVLDGNGAAVYFIPSPASQTASLVWNHQFVVSAGAAYGPVGRSLLAPFPAFALLPGWTLIPRVDQGQAGDNWASLTLTLTRIPTGPVQLAAPALTPTPLIA